MSKKLLKKGEISEVTARGLKPTHLFCKETLNNLVKQASMAKWRSVCSQTMELWVPVSLQFFSMIYLKLLFHTALILANPQILTPALWLYVLSLKVNAILKIKFPWHILIKMQVPIFNSDFSFRTYVFYFF